jgi:hypothetical protein
MTLEILVGADPEVFMKRDGVFRSAHGAVPGDKKNPFKVKCGAVQVDGMALEFNIDPAKNEKEFVTNLKTVMGVLQSMVPDYELAAVPVANFDEEHMKAQPLEALELGCEPDFNAWEGGAVNPRPDGAVNFRTGAGHVHIGWGKDFDINDPDHLEACQMVVKQLDYYLGLGSLVYDEEGAKRRVMYGAAGAYRPKSYGVEYRVLSNAWLKSEELMSWVFRMTKKGIDDLFNNKKAYLTYEDEARVALKAKKPNMAFVSCFMFDLGIDAPPGFKYKKDGWGSICGFEKV